jgi:hypothetical protein
VLEIGRLRTPGMFDLTWDKPEPLVARRYRLEVAERTHADGSISVPVDADGVLSAGAFFRAEGIESVAICFSIPTGTLGTSASRRASSRRLFRDRGHCIGRCAAGIG